MLGIALKEWAVVCDFLREGTLAMVLRKGGIHEEAGPGRFKLEHPKFVLFPAWEHQDPRKLKPQYREASDVFETEPSELTLRGVGQVDHIWQVPSRQAFDQLEDLHCWTREQIDMRFNYKPERPIYLLAVRGYRLAEAKTIPNRPVYSGCRSWVPLEADDAVDDAAMVSALDDAAFESILERIRAAMGS